MKALIKNILNLFIGISIIDLIFDYFYDGSFNYTGQEATYLMIAAIIVGSLKTWYQQRSVKTYS